MLLASSVVLCSTPSILKGTDVVLPFYVFLFLLKGAINAYTVTYYLTVTLAVCSYTAIKVADPCCVRLSWTVKKKERKKEIPTFIFLIQTWCFRCVKLAAANVALTLPG